MQPALSLMFAVAGWVHEVGIWILFNKSERERENYAEKGGNPFLHMLREWTLT